jgi:ubiquinone/menaquinone biosynthesis C-methylase UbiE
MTDDQRALWDDAAASFDTAPDHGLHETTARDAWTAFLRDLLPPNLSRPGHPAAIADLGCGTGTLSALFAREGHHVTGVDFSREMLRIAREKTAGIVPAPVFVEADVQDTPLTAGSFDVVLSRHVLWATADPASAVRAWHRLVRPGGVLLLIEGRWSTGAGLSAAECAALVAPLGGSTELRALDDSALWGGPIADERYALLHTTVADPP